MEIQCRFIQFSFIEILQEKLRTIGSTNSEKFECISFYFVLWTKGRRPRNHYERKQLCGRCMCIAQIKFYLNKMWQCECRRYVTLNKSAAQLEYVLWNIAMWKNCSNCLLFCYELMIPFEQKFLLIFQLKFIDKKWKKISFSKSFENFIFRLEHWI